VVVRCQLVEVADAVVPVLADAGGGVESLDVNAELETEVNVGDPRVKVMSANRPAERLLPYLYVDTEQFALKLSPDDLGQDRR